MTMIGGVDAEAMAATGLLVTGERWLLGRREAIGNLATPPVLPLLLVLTTKTAELLVLAVAGEWLQQPRGERIAGIENVREHDTASQN